MTVRRHQVLELTAIETESKDPLFEGCKLLAGASRCAPSDPKKQPAHEDVVGQMRNAAVAVVEGEDLLTSQLNLFKHPRHESRSLPVARVVAQSNRKTAESWRRRVIENLLLISFQAPQGRR